MKSYSSFIPCGSTGPPMWLHWPSHVAPLALPCEPTCPTRAVSPPNHQHIKHTNFLFSRSDGSTLQAHKTRPLACLPACPQTRPLTCLPLVYLLHAGCPSPPHPAGRAQRGRLPGRLPPGHQILLSPYPDPGPEPGCSTMAAAGFRSCRSRSRGWP